MGGEFITRAIIRKDDEILLAHMIGESNSFLSGGHVEAREFAKDAFQRELLEELGLDSEIDELVGVLEHKFTNRQEKS